ncbi:MAG: hypothetical protein ACREH3_20190, partial [Geminicoccales bacterium]
MRKTTCLRLGHARVAADHALLNLDRARHRVTYTRELDERAIAHQFDQTTPVIGNLRFDEFPPVGLEDIQRARLVLAHEPAVADDIGSQNRCQPALQTTLRPRRRAQCVIRILLRSTRNSYGCDPSRQSRAVQKRLRHSSLHIGRGRVQLMSVHHLVGLDPC